MDMPIVMPEPQLADNVVELRPGTPDAPIRRFGLTGLTPIVKAMAVGTGILIPAQSDWSDSEVKNLRNRINTVVHRAMEKSGDRFFVRTTVRGFEVWRMPSIPDAISA